MIDHDLGLTASTAEAVTDPLCEVGAQLAGLASHVEEELADVRVRLAELAEQNEALARIIQSRTDHLA